MSLDKYRYIDVYCDGSCNNNAPEIERDGGWSFAFELKGKTHIYYGHMPAPGQTNNTAELRALISILKLFKNSGMSIRLFPDSQYAGKSLVEWRQKWKMSGYPFKNQDLLLEMHAAHDAMTAKQRVLVKWVKGHSGDKMNSIVDDFANRGRHKQIKTYNFSDQIIHGFNDVQEYDEFCERMWSK